MDGTIIETEHIWQRVILDVIKERGFDLSVEQKEQISNTCRGIGMINGCIALKELIGLNDSVEALANEKRNRANALYLLEARFIQGFETFHNNLKANNIKTALATNACDSTLAVTKEALKLERFFGEHIYNISHVNNRAKPDPAMFLHAAEQLKVQPKDCIVIEDSAHGVQAARDAGMYCVGINSGNNRNLLKDAHYIIDGYHELELSKLPKLP